MPVHLPPISRRSFIQRSLAAGAGLLLAPHLVHAAKSTDPHTFAMLADPHISADPKETGRFGYNMTDHFQHVSREITALPTAPAGVIVHGDCARNVGKPGDYTQLIKLLEPLREHQLPIHLALGNHDRLDHFTSVVKPQTPTAVADKYVSTLSSERVNFFILDSLDGDPPGKPSNPGLLGEAQLKWLSTQLDQRKEKPAVVIVHHHPPSIRDYKKLLALMDDHQHVKAMFYGHRHCWGLHKTPGGVHLINLLPVSYPSPQEPDLGPNNGAMGWALATFGEREVRLRVSCINKEHKLHESVHELKWREG